MSTINRVKSSFGLAVFATAFVLAIGYGIYPVLADVVGGAGSAPRAAAVRDLNTGAGTDLNNVAGVVIPNNVGAALPVGAVAAGGTPLPTSIDAILAGVVFPADIQQWSSVALEDPYDVNGGAGNERIPGASIRTLNAAGASTEGVNVLLGSVAASTGAGVVGPQVLRGTLASDDPAVAALQIMDDWDEANRAAVNLVAAQIGVAAGTGVDAANALRITLATNVGLPAGLNNIGDVDIVTFPDNEPFDLNQWSGVAVADPIDLDTGAGTISAPGISIRTASAGATLEGVIVRGTDGTPVDVTAAFGAEADVVRFPDNEPFNVAQWGGVVPAAAAALADNAANPTAPAVGAMASLWDGGTWDRWPGDSSDGGRVELYTGGAVVGLAANPLAIRPSDGAAAQTFFESDLDTGAGTQNRIGVGLVVGAAGGGVFLTGDVANGLDVDVTRMPADATELAAAVALGDNAANPTVPQVGAFGALWDGGGWDRSPGAQDDGARVELYGGGDGTTGVALLTSDLDTGAGMERSLGVSLRAPAAGGSVSATVVTNDVTAVGAVNISAQDIATPTENYGLKSTNGSVDDIAAGIRSLFGYMGGFAWDPIDGNWDRVRTTGGADSGTLAAMPPANTLVNSTADAQLNGASASVLTHLSVNCSGVGGCGINVRTVWDGDCDAGNAAQTTVLDLDAAVSAGADYTFPAGASMAAGACVDVGANVDRWHATRR